METQTLEQLKKAMATKLSLTSKGYKATVKGMTPDEAIWRAVEAHTQMLALRERKESPAEKTRANRPVLILNSADGGYILKHGGGEATPYDPAQDMSEEYAVKIDLELNSKGIGWDVSKQIRLSPAWP